MRNAALLLGWAAFLPACGGHGGGASGAAPIARDVRVDQALPASVGGVASARSVCDGSNLYVVWIDHRNGISANGSGGVYFNRSADGGATWLATDVRLDRSASSAGFGDIPVLWCEGLTLVAAWQDGRNGHPDIYLNRSIDGGVTWQSDDRRLDTDPPGAGDSQNPHICGSGANVYVVWEDSRSGNPDIRFTRSADGGATWLYADVRLDTDVAGAATSSLPRVACSGADVYVVWNDRQAGAWNVRMNRSSTSGTTWLANDVRLDHVALGTQNATSPQVSCAGTTVCVAWDDDRNGAYDIYLNRSTDGGATWLGVDIRLDTDAGPGDSFLSHFVSNGANVYAVWIDNRSGRQDVFLNRSADQGATWLPADMRLDTDVAGAADSIYPLLSCSGANVVVAWVDTRGGDWDVYVNRSTNDGATWLGTDVRVDHGGTAYAIPVDICASGANVYAVWVDYRNSPVTFNETAVFSQRSTDGGGTWAPQDVPVSHALPAGVNGASAQPVLCVSGQSIFVAWIDFRLGHPVVYFNRSPDMGATWQPSDLQLSANGTSGVSNVKICCSGSKVYVVWDDARDGLQDIYFTRSVDGGASFSADLRLDTDTPGAASSDSPSISCAGDQVVVAWGDNRSGNADIRANRSLDGGVTWMAADVRVDRAPGATQAYEPQVCRNGDIIYVIWQDQRNGSAYDVYFNRSTTSGSTWAAVDVRLDTDAAGSAYSVDPRISCSGSNVYVAWQDNRNGGSEIRFNASADGGVSWKPADIRVDTAPVNTADRSFVRICAAGTSAYLTWQDGRSGAYRIHFNRSLDGGTTWLPDDVRIDSNVSAEGSYQPEIACRGNQVHVVWFDSRDAHPGLNDSDVYVNSSFDSGTTWFTSDARLDIGDTAHKESSRVRISADGLRPVAVWEDYRDGTADIYLGALER